MLAMLVVWLMQMQSFAAEANPQHSSHFFWCKNLLQNSADLKPVLEMFGTRYKRTLAVHPTDAWN